MEPGDGTFSVAMAPPAPALRPFVSSYYGMSTAAPLDDQFHPEWFNLRIPISGDWWGAHPRRPRFALPEGGVAHGPCTFLTDFGATAGVSFGVGLLPLGWARIMTSAASAIANVVAPLDEHLLGSGRLVHDLRAAPDFQARIELADAFFNRAIEAAPPDAEAALLEALHAAINDPATGSVTQLEERFGLTGPALTKLCRRWFGFAPKLLLRRQRFLRMLGAMHQRPPAQWRDFIDPLYVDQSHMIKDFNNFLGATPRRYFARPRPILREAARIRAELLGAPLQGLHAG